MRIGFIGAGHVGYSLAKYLSEKNHNVCGIYSKDISDAMDLAKFSVSEYYNDMALLALNCDTLFLTVNDNRLKEVIDNLINFNIHDKILIHTSGSISSDIFGNLKNNNSCYSLHPIYAFNDKYESFKGLDDVYFTLEGDNKYQDMIINLFDGRVFVINSENKELYHASCVFMSNLVCGLINESFNILKNIGIDNTNAFLPLIEENIKNIKQYGPLNALTGPVLRNDTKTILKHVLSLNKKDKDIYISISKILIEMSMLKTNNNYNEMLSILERNK